MTLLRREWYKLPPALFRALKTQIRTKNAAFHNAAPPLTMDT